MKKAATVPLQSTTEMMLAQEPESELSNMLNEERQIPNRIAAQILGKTTHTLDIWYMTKKHEDILPRKHQGSRAFYRLGDIKKYLALIDSGALKTKRKKAAAGA